MKAGRWLEAIVRDLRDGVRAMRRAPMATLVAVLTLGVGIGLNIAVFTVANATLFKGFRAVEQPDRLLYIGTQKDGRGCCVSYPDFADWRAQAQSFTGMGAVADLQIVVADGDGAAEHYDATQITPNTFALLGAAPIAGRDFTAADASPAAPPVAVLSYRFWQRRYAADRAIVGRSIRINGTPTTVVGIMPSGFAFPQNQDLWVPLTPTREMERRQSRRLWFAFGRLRDGVTFEEARSELAVIGQRLGRAYPDTNDGWIPAPRTFAQFFVGMNAGTVYGSLWGAVGFVLLIACGNFAHLQVARAVVRSREIAVRLALGAGHGRIARQIVIEGILLSSLGGAIGWWIARYGVRVYAAVANAPTRTWSEQLLDYSMDARVLQYGMAISLATGLVSGLIAASRLLRLDVTARLKDAGRGATEGRSGRRLAATLTAGQLALSLVLLAGAAALTRSFLNLSMARIGVSPDHVLTGLINLRSDSYRSPAARLSFFDRLTARLQTQPGVDAVAIASSPPASGGQRSAYEVGKTASLHERQPPTVLFVTIGPAFFKTLGASLLSGRDFDERDDTTAPLVAIVNEQFAREHWPGESAVGRRVRLSGDNAAAAATAWLTIVGVSSNIVQDITRQAQDPVVYVPFRQRPTDWMWVFARTRVAPAALAPAFRREAQALDPDLPIWIGPYTLSEFLDGAGIYWDTRNNAGLLLAAAAIGLLLASVGLYAVTAQGVAERTREIGIRMAVGASEREILGMIVTQAMRPTAIGLLIGLLGSLVVNRLLQSALVNVSPGDPGTYVVAAVTLVLFAAVGCLIPARHAMRVDPVIALRSE